MLAHMAGEPALIEAFRSGEDIHDRTALQLFGPDSGLSRHELRSCSKMVNYAVLYGKTPFTLSKDINVTQEAAQEFIDAYFKGFPHVRVFIDQMLDEARRTGVVKTMFGRRRLVPNLTSRNFQMRAQLMIMRARFTPRFSPNPRNEDRFVAFVVIASGKEMMRLRYAFGI